jgi:hypothetical protein
LAFSLLIGALFAFLVFPTEVGASFLNSILNTEAYAQNSDLNSQNMPLLQPNVSLAQLLQGKDEKKDNKIDSKVTISIVSDTSLLATASPQSAAGEGTGGGNFSFEENDTEIYVVKAGDTPQIVADMFEISVDTIYLRYFGWFLLLILYVQFQRKAK